MKLKKKRVKGMTLIEVIIALAIFTLLAAIMVRVGAVTKSLMMNTNHLNNKTTAESPIGAVQDVDGLEDIANAMHPTDPAAAQSAINAVDMQVTVKSGSSNTVLNVTRYSTKLAADEAAANGINCDTSNHMNGDLQFYEIQP